MRQPSPPQTEPLGQVAEQPILRLDLGSVVAALESATATVQGDFPRL